MTALWYEMKMSDLPINEFRRFIEKAKTLAPTMESNGPPALPINDFCSFVEKSKPLVVGPVREKLEELRVFLQPIKPWILPYDLDLLRITQLTYMEDPYTELIAWAIDPNTHPDSGLARQQAWLDTFDFGKPLTIKNEVAPRTQLGTPEGVPDLVLNYEEFVVVVEAKTKSKEHKVRSGKGEMQTIAYESSVLAPLRRKPDTPVYVVFLTENGEQAANSKAYNATYLEFVHSLCLALAGYSLPDEVFWAFCLTITHLFTHACPSEVKAELVAKDIDPWLRPPSAIPDTEIIQRLAEINQAQKILEVYHD